MSFAGFVLSALGSMLCDAVNVSLALSILCRNSPLGLPERGDTTVVSMLVLLDALCRGGGGGGIAGWRLLDISKLDTDDGLPGLRPEEVRVGGGAGAAFAFTMDLSASVLEDTGEEIDDVCDVCRWVCGRRLGGGGGALRLNWELESSPAGRSPSSSRLPYVLKDPLRVNLGSDIN